jgi:DNA invertase Pin-like site-specific DNA recombinase
MATMAYIRVSSKDQNEGRQVDKMKELVSDDRFMFIDKASGKNFDRPAYQAMKMALREGDLLYIDAIDRLGRNFDGIIDEWKDITRNIGADIVALDMAELFDSRRFKEMGDMGKLMENQMLSLLSYMAETERKKIRQRQREGIDRAKAEGKYKGRPKTDVDMVQWEALYAMWKRREIGSGEFMKRMDLKRDKFYKTLHAYEKNKEGK